MQAPSAEPANGTGEPRPAAQRPPRAGPRVLMIRPSALGDVARTVPCLVALRRAMPDAHIDWLVQDSFAEVIRHHPMLDGVVEFPRKQLAGPLGAVKALRWSSQLKRNRYDIVIDLQGLFRSGWLAWRTGAPRRIGYANAREMGWLGCNRRHHVDSGLHAVDRMIGLLAAEGFPPSHDMRLYCASANPLAPSPSGPYMLLAPTARWRCKCWPLENYAAIARRLLDANLTRHLLILAAPTEHAHVAPLVEAIRSSHPHATVSLPSTNIAQMMAFIRDAGLVICNDSGPLHIAVGFDRPIVTIFGPTDPGLVGPYRRDASVVRPTGSAGLGEINYYRKHRDDQSLIAKVSVDAVWDCVLKETNRQA
jgi:lipopolysaccharide heptosyltransferase I